MLKQDFGVQELKLFVQMFFKIYQSYWVQSAGNQCKRRGGSDCDHVQPHISGSAGRKIGMFIAYASAKPD